MEILEAKTAGARAIVLVEGISDQIALETLAVRRGRDLAAERVVIVPTGGAHGVRRMQRQPAWHGKAPEAQLTSPGRCTSVWSGLYSLKRWFCASRVLRCDISHLGTHAVP